MLDSQGMSINLLTNETVNNWQLNMTDFFYWHISNFNEHVLRSLSFFPSFGYRLPMQGDSWAEIQLMPA